MTASFNIIEKLYPLILGDSKSFLDLLDQVWKSIPEVDQQVIWENLTTIKGVSYSMFNQRQQEEKKMTPTEAGRTFLNEETGLCEIWIDISRPQETIKFSMAHELAHVFYNHPRRTEEVNIEEEANTKAKAWGYLKPL
jgi:hypothetical protein